MKPMTFKDVVNLQTRQATLLSLSETTAVCRRIHSKRVDRLEMQPILSETLSRQFQSYTANVIVVKERWGENRTNYCAFFRLYDNRIHSFHVSLLNQDTRFTTMTLQTTGDREMKKLPIKRMIQEEWMEELKHSFLVLLTELPLYRLRAVTGGLVI